MSLPAYMELFKMDSKLYPPTYLLNAHRPAMTAAVAMTVGEMPCGTLALKDFL